MPTLKLANWASDTLNLYLAEKERLEEELRTFEQRYGRVISDLTRILRDLLDSPENQALLNKCRRYSLRGEIPAAMNAIKPVAHKAFFIGTMTKSSPDRHATGCWHQSRTR